MTLIVPDTREVIILSDFLTLAHSLKLFSNNATPSGTSTAASFTEAAGGGYVAKSLLLANWTITGGAPSVAIYDTVQEWIFTGPTTAPSTIYGYFIVETASGLLKWAERFPSGNVPFTPIIGSIIRVTPKITCQSA